MQSFLIVSREKKSVEDYTYKLCEELSIDNFDITFIDKNLESIGIGDIRNLQSKIFLKPFKSKFKAAVIKNSDKLTTEAQNALLKILEEPPLSAIIILTASSKEVFLPTITSRCRIIELKEKEIESTEKESDQYLNIIISLNSPGIGEKLKIAQNFGKTREEAIAFLEKTVISARKKLMTEILTNNQTNQLIYYYVNLLKSFGQAYTVVKTTNTNPRLALEKLFLDLPEN